MKHMYKSLAATWAIALISGQIFAQNVGVDVATPQQKLDVAGAIKLGNTSSGVGGSIRWNGTTYQVYDPAIPGWRDFGTGTDNDWMVVGNNMYSQLSGNVGIGTTTPAYTLHVAGSARVSSLNINGSYSFPTGPGVNGYVLTTDGSGTVTWSNPALVGDITEVVAGLGLINGGTSGVVTLDVNPGDGIQIASDQVRVRASDLDNTTNGLAVTGNDLIVNVDGSTLDINGDELVVADNGITATQIANNTITVDNIGSGAVGSDEIIDGSITATDIASAGNNQVLTTDGSGVPQWQSQNSMIGSQAGDGLVNDAANSELDVNPGDGIALNSDQVQVLASDLDGSGITVTANNFDVNVDNSTLEINSDQVRIKADGVNATHIATGGVTTTEILDGTVLAADVSSPGTGNLVLSTNAAGVVGWNDPSELTTSLKDRDSDTYISVDNGGSPDDDNIRMFNRGNESLTINEDGNVGLGTGGTAPYRLQVTINESSGLNFPLLLQNDGAVNNSVTGAGIGFQNGGGSDNPRMALYTERTTDYSRGKMHFLLRNTGDDTPVTLSDARMTILSNGNVGVGTVDPTTNFHVSGGVRVSSLTNGVVISDPSGVLSSGSLVGTGFGDNLGNHTATTNLDMNSREIDNTRYYDVLAGNGNGIRFWQSNNYKIHMGNAAENRYGDVQDYSIKMNMNNDSEGDRGWTWGVDGLTPVFSVSTAGHATLDGSLYLDCVTCGSTSDPYPTSGSGWGNMVLQGRVVSANSNIHLSPPAGSNVIIDDNYRAAGGSSSGTAGLTVERLAGGGDRAVFTDNSGNLFAANMDGSGLGDNLGDHVADQNLNMNGFDVDFIRGDQGQIRSVGTISFDWTGGTYDDSRYHGIESKNEAGGFEDDIRINSYDNITATLDANNNNSTSYFKIQERSTGNGTDNWWSSTGGDMYNRRFAGFGVGPQSGYAIYAQGTSYGIRAFGSTMGGRFEDSNSSARVYCGYDAYDVLANGTGRIDATSQMRAPIYYDRNNTGYYFHGDGESRMYRSEAQYAWGTWTTYDANSSAYYVNPSSVSAYNDLRANIFYDRASTYWYLDPGSSMRVTGQAEISRNGGRTYIGNGWSADYCVGGWYCCSWNWWGDCNGSCYSSCLSTAWHVKLDVNGAAQSRSWLTVSDGRMKKDISTIGNALQLVKSIRGVTYNWKDLGETNEEVMKRVQNERYDISSSKANDNFTGFQSDIGVIAQELQEVIPHAVQEVEDFDSTGAVIGSHLAVNYDNLIPVLIEAIKEQQMQIEELQTMTGLNRSSQSITSGKNNDAMYEAMRNRADGMSKEVQNRVDEIIEMIEGGHEMTPAMRKAINEFITNGTVPEMK